MTPAQFLDYLLSLPEEARLDTIDGMYAAIDSGALGEGVLDEMQELLSGVNAISAFPEAQGPAADESALLDYALQAANAFGVGPNATIGVMPGQEGFDPHLSMAEALVERGLPWPVAGVAGTIYDFVEPGVGEWGRAASGLGAMLIGSPRVVQNAFARVLREPGRPPRTMGHQAFTGEGGLPRQMFHGTVGEEVGTTTNPVRDAAMPNARGEFPLAEHREGHGHTGLFGTDRYRTAEAYGPVVTPMVFGVKPSRVLSVGESAPVTPQVRRTLDDMAQDARTWQVSPDDSLTWEPFLPAAGTDSATLADLTYLMDNAIRGSSSWTAPLPPGATSLTARRLQMGFDAFEHLGDTVHPEAALYRAGSGAHTADVQENLRLLHRLGAFDGVSEDKLAGWLQDATRYFYDPEETVEGLAADGGLFGRAARFVDGEQDVLRYYDPVRSAWEGADVNDMLRLIQSLQRGAP